MENKNKDLTGFFWWQNKLTIVFQSQVGANRENFLLKKNGSSGLTATFRLQNRSGPIPDDDVTGILREDPAQVRLAAAGPGGRQVNGDLVERGSLPGRLVQHDRRVVEKILKWRSDRKTKNLNKAVFLQK